MWNLNYWPENLLKQEDKIGMSIELIEIIISFHFWFFGFWFLTHTPENRNLSIENKNFLFFPTVSQEKKFFIYTSFPFVWDMNFPLCLLVSAMI